MALLGEAPVREMGAKDCTIGEDKSGAVKELNAVVMVEVDWGSRL